MRQLRTEANVSFYAEYPEDDLLADARADLLSDQLEDAIGSLDGVVFGTVRIEDLDTVAE